MLSLPPVPTLHTMIAKRIPSLPRPASILRSVRPARAFSTPSAPVQGVQKSNVVLELDVKDVGREIRKRGLASSVSSASGMDRVSRTGLL